jgi:probable phosphoglycerate mutase
VTRFVLVRHGETVWHADNRYAGVTDIALTATGEAQAEQLGRWARDAGLAAIWASPLSRARRTAAACADATGLEVQVDDRLRELDFGTAEGLTAAEMADRIPLELAAFREDPVRHFMPGGEDPRAAAARFVAALDAIGASHPDGRVLVVAHTTAIRLALCRLLGLALSSYRRTFPLVGNCSITEVDRGADRTALLQFNTPLGGAVAGVTGT